MSEWHNALVYYIAIVTISILYIDVLLSCQKQIVLRDHGAHPNQVSRVSTATTSSKGLLFLGVLLTTLSVPSTDSIDSEFQNESAIERRNAGVFHCLRCVARIELFKSTESAKMYHR